jgi:hypothetical protein
MSQNIQRSLRPSLAGRRDSWVTTASYYAATSTAPSSNLAKNDWNNYSFGVLSGCALVATETALCIKTVTGHLTEAVFNLGHEKASYGVCKIGKKKRKTW